jgi:UDP-N-acetylglucosamine 1-carboxyvinyltransferase
MRHARRKRGNESLEESLLIRGESPLTGEVSPSGAKNAAVAILPAALLCDEATTVENLPKIRDVEVLHEILGSLGATVTYADGRMTIDPAGVRSLPAEDDLTSQMRASYYLLGAMLGKFGEATISMPGGCPIGTRPIDQHLKGMEALGAEIDVSHGYIIARARGGRLVGGEVYLDVVSVGATANMLMAASRARGRTTIVNAAKEPHIVDLANFLNSMGANIKGAGTDVIRIQGVDAMHGSTYAVIPDQIETGTFMIAAAIAGGDVLIKNVIPMHMESVSAKLIEMGVIIEEGGDTIRVRANPPYDAITVKTMPYPGFPTDLQQPISALLATARGLSMVEENIFEDRFKHLSQFARMGARTRVTGRVALIEGVPNLQGAEVTASDLRAGAALVLAALGAKGETRIAGLWHIDRGYDRLEEKLRALGADIRRVEG